MSSSPKCRYYVTVGEQSSELFSVAEKKSGELIIINKNNINHEDEGQDIKIVYERFSVHVSPLSSGTTIKRTLSLVNGDHHTSAAWIDGPKDKLVCPIHTKRCSDLRGLQFLMKSRGLGKNILVFDNLPKDTSLIYTVVITASDVLPAIVENHNLIISVFGRYNLNLYYCFINFPGSNTEDSMYYVTSPLRINGKSKTGPVIKHAKSPIVRELVEKIGLSNKALLGRMLERYVSAADEQSIKFFMEEYLFFFTPEPINMI